jgi:hypothetical protein
MHHGPLAASISISLCATVRPMPFRFLGIGGSLAETGFVFTSPHLMALASNRQGTVLGDHQSNKPVLPGSVS